MTRKNDNKIKLSPEEKEYMVSEIKNYFYTERAEDIGDLASMLILDFVIEKLAPKFYNQGIYEAYQFMDERLEDVLGIQR